MYNNLLKIVFVSLAITVSTYLVSPTQHFSLKNVMICSSIVFLVYNILYNLENSIFKHYQEGLGFGLGGKLVGEGFQNQPNYVGLGQDASVDLLSTASSEYIKMLLKDVSGDDSREIIEQNRKNIIENNKITVSEENKISDNIKRLCSDVGFQSTAGYNNTDECIQNLRVMLNSRLNKFEILKQRLNDNNNSEIDPNELNLLVKFINNYLLLNNIDDLLEIGQTRGQKYALYNYIDYYINSFLIQDKRFLFLLSAVLSSSPDQVFTIYKNSMSQLFKNNEYLKREVNNICNNAATDIKSSCISSFNKYINYTHKNLAAFIITSMLTYDTTIDMFKNMFKDVLDTRYKWEKHVRLYNININWLLSQPIVLSNLKRIYYKNATNDSWNKFETYIKSQDFVEYLNTNSKIFLNKVINRELAKNNPNIKYYYFYYINFFAEKFMDVTQDNTEEQERKLEKLRQKNRKLYGIDTDKYGCIKGEKYCADSSVGDVNGKCISGQAVCDKDFTGKIYRGSDINQEEDSGNNTNLNPPPSLEDTIADDKSIDKESSELLDSDKWLKSKSCQFFQYILRKNILGSSIKDKDKDISNNSIISNAKYFKIFTIQKDSNGDKIDNSANTFYLKENDFRNWFQNKPDGVKNCILCVFNNLYILNYNYDKDNKFTDKNGNIIDLNNEIKLHNINKTNKIYPKHKLILLLKYVTKGTNISKSLLVPFTSVVEYYDWIKLSKNFNIIANCHIESYVKNISTGNPPTPNEINNIIKKIKEKEASETQETSGTGAASGTGSGTGSAASGASGTGSAASGTGSGTGSAASGASGTGSETSASSGASSGTSASSGARGTGAASGSDRSSRTSDSSSREAREAREARSRRLEEEANKELADRDRIERRVRERETARRDAAERRDASERRAGAEREMRRRGRGEKDIDSDLIKQISKQFTDSIELELSNKEKERKLKATDGPQGYVYLPPKHWMLPQKRHQVCKTEKRCPVCPAYTENNPTNLMSSDMWNTDLLSISNATPRIVKKSTKCNDKKCKN